MRHLVCYVKCQENIVIESIYFFMVKNMRYFQTGQQRYKYKNVQPHSSLTWNAALSSCILRRSLLLLSSRLARLSSLMESRPGRPSSRLLQSLISLHSPLRLAITDCHSLRQNRNDRIIGIGIQEQECHTLLIDENKPKIPARLYGFRTHVHQESLIGLLLLIFYLKEEETLGHSSLYSTQIQRSRQHSWHFWIIP